MMLTDIFETKAGGCPCRIFATQAPACLLIQPTARHEVQALQHEVALLDNGTYPIALATIDVGLWARALMPWPDAAVSHHTEVGRHATDTLHIIVHRLLPTLQQRYGALPSYIGGYSLGGLFALWAATREPCFQAVAAVSPSVWIEGWTAYAAQHPTLARYVYLSLGQREPHCRNPHMAQVGNAIEQQHTLLKKQLGEACTCLQRPPGGHFDHEGQRMAAAWQWLLQATITTAVCKT